MTSRAQLTAELNQIEQDMKSLEIAYEQYFMGVEKREPYQLRQKVTKQVRHLVNCYIPQVDLRFRVQGITSRFNSYAGHWDRTLRLIDEGKYERHTSRIKRAETRPQSKREAPVQDPMGILYDKLAKAHRDCGMKVPSKEQVTQFIAKQQKIIREKFGERNVDFVVVTENNKPKIKVRAKNK